MRTEYDTSFECVSKPEIIFTNTEFWTGKEVAFEDFDTSFYDGFPDCKLIFSKSLKKSQVIFGYEKVRMLAYLLHIAR